jgi:hypothetical protein
MLARIRDKNLDKWLPGYLRHLIEGAVAPRYEGHRHLLFALCDHFEPQWMRPPPQIAETRVLRWREDYPRLARAFRDADGRHPRHSFFFPGEEYVPSHLDALAEIARAGMGEVELHLHHDGDTAENMRREVLRYLGLYAEHGHLAREDGRVRYGFIHGNWCLANARTDGRWCGVDGELPLLFETGCYADFTFPAAPDQSQPGIVNRIYWPDGNLGRRRAYEAGRRARVGEVLSDRILIIQGPLALALRPDGRRLVGIENADVTARNPPTAARISAWVRQNIHVAGRPDWVFVKVHTHGAQELQMEALLGEAGQALHRELTSRYNDGRHWSLHYVTAREMYNVALAAIHGEEGSPSDYLDYRLAPPPVARR